MEEILDKIQELREERKALEKKLDNASLSDMEKLIQRRRELDIKCDEIGITLFGGIRPDKPEPQFDYKYYLQSVEWKVKANAAKAKAGYACQVCNVGGELHAHHRTYDRIGNEEPEDITILCSECHARFHNKVSEK